MLSLNKMLNRKGITRTPRSFIRASDRSETLPCVERIGFGLGEDPECAVPKSCEKSSQRSGFQSCLLRKNNLVHREGGGERKEAFVWKGEILPDYMYDLTKTIK
ncbi:hypothetical protein Mp_1g20390 [Marchantia polymorpha subsp. ruderalis]|uniref:Uncharacterized protein n=2 Tax=Marchantia polymorpha TaxID=3197 RepID=A0AAF6AS97_MARPO|nr:hypothetical protein MARPO_0001s0376 [Marchantia polymorpha]BBM99317.1 hypothetical protein Mp_1g20390 [Marchantia polymorpha subsp. ruderalis]|eukprot:PTQ50399.1 hypothetical protein MARPO_0001s0376 [Marchantia polymorpha]